MRESGTGTAEPKAVISKSAAGLDVDGFYFREIETVVLCSNGGYIVRITWPICYRPVRPTICNSRKTCNSKNVKLMAEIAEYLTSGHPLEKYALSSPIERANGYIVPGRYPVIRFRFTQCTPGRLPERPGNLGDIKNLVVGPLKFGRYSYAR